MIAVDVSWLAGGNRQRGVGRYLAAYFRQPQWRGVPVVWLGPAAVPVAVRRTWQQTYGGEWVTWPDKATPPHQQQWWRQTRLKYDIDEVLLASPFERPHCLTDWSDTLTEGDCQVTAIIFDVLPSQFPSQILATWSNQDQERYRARQVWLAQQSLQCISPWVKTAVEQYWQVKPAQIQVIEFGLQPDWLSWPSQIDRPGSRSATILWRQQAPLVVTIAGGEWRKNLGGTLRFFAQAFPSPYRLVVINALSWREHLHWRQVAWQLGLGRRGQFVGRVSDRVKWAYLLRAEAFLFLSHGEGLGIPLLEARRAGVPRIIISRALEQNGVGQILPPHYEVAW